MKTLTVLTLLGSLSMFSASFLNPGDEHRVLSTDSTRFQISVDGKTGYIDSNGTVVIAPRFEAGQEFSEGIGAVRINGRYGFIDTSGKVVINPTFDYATQFVEGLALVFIDGKPLFINKDGSTAFKSGYKTMTPFRKGRSRVRTYSGNIGIIDKRGKLLIDTVYSRIDEFSEGLAVVWGVNHQNHRTKERRRRLEISVIDTTGKRLVEYGKYQEIYGPDEGYFRATRASKQVWSSEDIILDRNGKEVYAIPPSKKKNDFTWLESGVSDGLIRITLSNKGEGDNNLHEAYMTPYGKIIFEGVSQKYSRDFSNNRAFVQNIDDSYSVINTRGELVIKETFNDVLGVGFHGGRAFVETGEGWGLIDTTGRFIIPPIFKGIDHASIGSDLIFFASDKSDVPRYGFADSLGNVIFPATLSNFDRAGFVNGLLSAYLDNDKVYINKQGKIVWQGDMQPLSSRDPLNIDYMMRGYFYAHGTPTGHSGGEDESTAQIITGANDFRAEKFTVLALPERQHESQAPIQTMTVFVANATTDTAFFNAQDGRLYMKMQALDTKGEWRDIEYLPSSWCGNSYYTLSLSPGHYWSFAAPVYQGTYNTRLRVELKVIDNSGTSERKGRSSKEIIVYSNGFTGSVNPAQFWRKQIYNPMGIMDPYNE